MHNWNIVQTLKITSRCICPEFQLIYKKEREGGGKKMREKGRNINKGSSDWHKYEKL